MLNLTKEELIAAIESRHSVRQYDESRPIEAEKIEAIKNAVDMVNARSDHKMSFRLVQDEPRAFGGRWASYGNFRGVANYIVVAAEKGDSADVACGESGEDIVLLLQHLGLGSCWVGLTYKKIDGAFELPEDHNIRCLIAFGYAATGAYRNHKSKSLRQVSNVTDESPEWFKEGVRLALLAPTAVNQQKFFFELSQNKVVASTRFSLIGYTRIDLGITLTHFKIGALPHHYELIIK